MPPTAPLLALAALLSLLPLPASAQESAQAIRQEIEEQLRRDSVRVLRAARSEQASFERIRKNNLPWAWGGGSGECDERIGRFCLTYSEDEQDEWVPPPEPEEVGAARERLIARLGSAARVIPGDGWVAGQRVRYLMEAKRTAAAVGAAAACAAEGWWCAALAGFAHHQAGDAARADSTFALALRGMPEDERRRWNDLSHLLEGSWLDEYRRAEGAEREGFEERFWRTADPLFMVPGNDLRTEHYSRNVWDQLQDRARSPDGISWGDDLREIMLRYGLPSGWERVRPRSGLLSGDISIVTHYPEDDLPFLPPADPLREAWDEESTRARTGYKLPAFDWFRRLDHQLAVFRRGDSAVVVAAYQLPADSLPADSRVDAALVFMAADAEPSTGARRETGSLSGTLTAWLQPQPVLVSLETLVPAARRAARARRGMAMEPLPPGLLALSDLLLLNPSESLPDSLAAAVAGARGSTRFRAGDRLGLYWELYGLDTRPESLSMTLRLAAAGGGWLRRAAERIGLVRELAPVRLRWQEQSEPAPAFARSLALQIPEVPPGEYSLELSVTVPGREPLRVTRAIRVER